MKVCAGNRKGKYSEIWALWVSTGRVLYVFLSARHKTVGNGPAVLLQLVNCSDVEGPYSMPPMNSSLKTNSVFQVGVLGFPFLLTLLCSGVCNWRGVRWFTEIRGFLHNHERIWHSFVMCLGTEAAKTDFPFLSLTLYQPYAKYRAVCWVSLISNQLHVQLGSLISDYGLIWDMRSEKEVGVICSGPEVMQNQSPRSPSSQRLTLLYQVSWYMTWLTRYTPHHRTHATCHYLHSNESLFWKASIPLYLWLWPFYFYFYFFLPWR